MTELSLSELSVQAWQLLRRGAVDAKSPYHSASLVSYDGARPQARQVILREVDSPAASLTLHTDIRSPKVDQIKAFPLVSWLFWHPKQRIQLRMHGKATVHHLDDQTQAAWQSLSPSSRLNYSSQLPPSQFIETWEAGKEVQATYEDLAKCSTDDWYPHFAVIQTHLSSFEYLQLRREGHLRAHFDWQQDSWRGQWLVP
ncbi:MAG: pyridoxamine 5'-phosphate oxidase family protein [Bacteroidota bacterium]